jgi:hypothetical protein
VRACPLPAVFAGGFLVMRQVVFANEFGIGRGSGREHHRIGQSVCRHLMPDFTAQIFSGCLASRTLHGAEYIIEFNRKGRLRWIGAHGADAYEIRALLGVGGT